MPARPAMYALETWPESSGPALAVALADHTKVLPTSTRRLALVDVDCRLAELADADEGDDDARELWPFGRARCAPSGVHGRARSPRWISSSAVIWMVASLPFSSAPSPRRRSSHAAEERV